MDILCCPINSVTAMTVSHSRQAIYTLLIWVLNSVKCVLISLRPEDSYSRNREIWIMACKNLKVFDITSAECRNSSWTLSARSQKLWSSARHGRSMLPATKEYVIIIINNNNNKNTGNQPSPWIFKYEFSMADSALMCQISSKLVPPLLRYGDLKLATIRHVGFVGCIFWSPINSTLWSLSSCKICFELVQ